MEQSSLLGRLVHHEENAVLLIKYHGRIHRTSFSSQLTNEPNKLNSLLLTSVVYYNAQAY